MNKAVFAGVAAAALASAASADYTGAVQSGYWVNDAADFSGTVSVYVVDVYMTSDTVWGGTDGSGDTLLNVYNWNSAGAPGAFFQSFTGTGWQPTNLGGPFDTPALRAADSFVTIGGFAQDTLAPEQAPGSGAGSGLDPNFGGNNTSFPGTDAGWFNGSPPSLNGAVDTVAGAGTIDGSDFGVLIGRFAFAGDFTIVDSTLWVTWNQGLGSPGQQAGFTVVPAPGALALLGLAGMAGRRRR